MTMITRERHNGGWPQPAADPLTLGDHLHQYDLAKHGADPGELAALLARTTGAAVTTLVVDNKREGDWTATDGPSRTVIGGDNARWEFSGWAKGVRYLLCDGQRYDLVLFATDAYPVNRGQFIRCLTGDTIRFAAPHGVATGLFQLQRTGSRTGPLCGVSADSLSARRPPFRCLAAQQSVPWSPAQPSAR